MRLRRNTLNNVTMDNVRGTQTYQTIITDLAIKGAISRDIAESLLGYEIPYYLHTPDGKSFPKTTFPADMCFITIQSVVICVFLIVKDNNISVISH